MKKLLYTLIFLITVTTYSQKKREWKEITKKYSSDRVYIREQSYGKFWIKVVFSDLTSSEYYRKNSYDTEELIVKSTISLYQVDCYREIIGLIETDIYNNYNMKVSNYYEFDNIYGDYVGVYNRYPLLEIASPDSKEEYYLDKYCELYYNTKD